MHETMAGHQGMAAMKPVTSVQVPAGSEVKFEPGGKHVMLWNINPGLAPPKRIPLQLSFSNGERLRVYAPLVAAGNPAPDTK
jgi:periplasmic copper chaperone A